MGKLGKNYRSIVFLLVGSGGGAALTFFLQVILANELKISDYGKLTSYNAFLSLMLPIFAFGCTGFLLSFFAKYGISAKVVCKKTLYYFCISSGVVFFIVFFKFFYKNQLNWWMILYIYVTAGLIPAFNQLLSVKLQVEDRFSEYSLIQYLQPFIKFIIVLIYIYTCGEIFLDDYFLFFYFSSGLILAFFSIKLLREILLSKWALKEGVLGEPLIGLRGVVLGAFPYGVAGLMHLIYFQSPVFLLSIFSSYEEVSLFNVAFIFANAVYLFPSIFYSSYLIPKIHFLGFNDKDKLIKMHYKGILVMFVFSLAVIFISNLLVDFFISFSFDGSYAESKELFFLMSLAIPFRFLSIVFGSILNLEKFVKRKNILMFSVALFSLTMSFLFLSTYGAKAAVFIYIFSEIILCFLYFNFSRTVIITLKNDLKG